MDGRIWPTKSNARAASRPHRKSSGRHYNILLQSDWTSNFE